MDRGTKVLLGLLFFVPLLWWGVARTVHDVQFNREIDGHLERAANANTVALAASELGVALEGAKRWNLTEGYTSIFYRTPDEDLGYWYTNLSQAYAELQTIPESAAPLERSNVLMKLRETIMESGSKGSQAVTVPEGASIYPDNTMYFSWGLFGALAALAGAVILLGVASDY